MLRPAAALLAVSLTLTPVLASKARADEGMWTFDNFPAARVNQTYGTRIDQAWLDRVRNASVRLTTGCSASLVSPEGLVLTNHHCIVGCAQDLSSAQTDYVAKGFLTRARTEEKQCPGMQAEILTSIADVTERVTGAGAGKSGQDFVRARDAETARIEAEGCGTDASLRCQVVSLYRGGQYKLYKYRKYADVRLAFAPEFQAAFFGGDPDNFSFPRYALDSAFVRLYENGRPIASPAYLPWNAEAPKENEPVFVSGNPGSTNRLQTVSQLQTLRDLVIPHQQLQRSELRGRLIRFSQESPENKRIATDPLFGVENSYKNYYGRMRFLADPAFFEGKRRAEAEVQSRIASRRNQISGDPWREIAEVQDDYAELYLPYTYVEGGGGGSSLYGYARTLVRGAQERAKPASQRLPEFSESRLPLIEKNLLDARPVEPELEELYLSFWLSKAREFLTADDPDTRLLLGRDSPDTLADRLVTGTRLADPAERARLWKGGLAAIQASQDPMIQYVLRTEGRGRELRRQWEQRVTAPTDRASEQIAKAQFLAYGDDVYPDATFTLRLSYGKIAGWTERGRRIPAFTYIKGLYERATGQEPFELAPRWAAARTRVKGDTVFDMASTNDIIGGNSGSPLINARGEVIGAVFDSNLAALGGAYGYVGETNRSVTVSTAAITEALRTVYDQPQLVRELTGGRRATR
ncbi:MAG: S46 family peptidase [Proteobacteria bacterium]|nr:S46 family peptidase [Pseudomonadota bacterium]